MDEKAGKRKFSFKYLSRKKKVLISVAGLLIIVAIAGVWHAENDQSLTELNYHRAVKDFERADYRTLSLTKVEKSTDNKISDFKYNDDNDIVVYCARYIEGDCFTVRVIAQDVQNLGYQVDANTIEFYLLKDGKVVNWYNDYGFVKHLETEQDQSLYACDYYFKFDENDNYAHNYTVEIFNSAEQIKYICDFGLI